MTQGISQNFLKVRILTMSSKAYSKLSPESTLPSILTGESIADRYWSGLGDCQ
jgi:hypothetical protein